MKLAIATLSILFTFSIKAQNIKITYLANEGVLIESSSRKIIIDALFDDYYEDYLSLSVADRQKVIQGQSPYNQIDLLLATHIHRDHFEAQLTGEFLSSHTESKFLSSNQVRADLEEKYQSFADIKDRIVAYERDVFTVREEINGVLVHSFFINHAGGERAANIENMGFIIELDGKRILHLGDADMKIDRFKAVDLAQYNIDIAMVPYWYMADDTGITIVNDYIKAKNLIGVHFPKAGSPLALSEIANKFPKARVFQKQFEESSY